MLGTFSIAFSLECYVLVKQVPLPKFCHIYLSQCNFISVMQVIIIIQIQSVIKLCMKLRNLKLKISDTTVSIDPEINITLLSEQFESDGAVVTLEWVHQNSYLYNVSITPLLLELAYGDVTRITFCVSYNTHCATV